MFLPLSCLGVLVTFLWTVTAETSWGDCGLLKCVENWPEEISSYEYYLETLPPPPPTYQPIPLLSVDVKARVTHSVAEVEVTQVYRNVENVPIEAVYHFPLNPEGAVSGFWAEVDGRTVKGVVKTKEKAREAYDNAVRNRTSAFLGEEVKPDIFKLRVGYLRPGSQAKIVFSYVTEVKNEPGTNHIRFYIPTTVAPRYVSPSETDEAAENLKNMTFSPTSAAPLKLDVAVVLLGEIQSITSPTHDVTVEMIRLDTRNGTLHAASVELEGVTTDMDRDFVLNIVPVEIHLPRLYSEKDENGTTAVMVHFIPYFNISEQKSEFIFVLDRSGSMMGRSIELARQALQVFLHSLPADCYFNVIGFDSSFEFLFKNSVKYSEETLAQAITHATNIQADLGGTKIFEPLVAIYGRPPVASYYSRQIFLLTDGQVWNTDSVVSLIRRNAQSTRVFALGIGDGASHHLVEGAAKAGGGTSAFVTNNEALDAKVVNQLKSALKPNPSRVELEWEWGNVTHTAIKQSPKTIPPIFNGSQVLVFALFESDLPPKSLTIRAQSPDGPVTFKLNHSEANEIGRGIGMIHRLAAVKLIRELELEVAALREGGGHQTTEETRLVEEIEKISVQNGVTSKYTSFIAVDERSSADSSNDTFVLLETRLVPSQLPNGRHGGDLADNGDSSEAPLFFGRTPSNVGFLPISSNHYPDYGPLVSGWQYSSEADHQMGSHLHSEEQNSIENFDDESFSHDFNNHHWNVYDHSRHAFSQEIGNFQDHAQPSSDLTPSLGHYIQTWQPPSIPTYPPPMRYTPPPPLRPRHGKTSVSWNSSPSDIRRDPIADSSNLQELMQLIRAQRFDGSFRLRDLASVVGKTEMELRQESTKGSLSESEFATALALHLFRTRFSDNAATSELVVRKATKWLATQNRNVETTIQLASNFLN